MALRPTRKLQNVTIVSKQVKSGVTITKGVGVKKGTTDDEVDLCAAGDKIYGIAMETLLGDGVKRAEIALVTGGGVVPVKVGTAATATCGEFAEAGTAGFANRTLGGGTTVRYLGGYFDQDGVAGDEVGLVLGGFAAGSA